MLAEIQPMPDKHDNATASSAQTALSESACRTTYTINVKNGLNGISLDLESLNDSHEVLQKLPPRFSFRLNLTSSHSDGQDRAIEPVEDAGGYTARLCEASELTALLTSLTKGPDKLYRAQGLEINFEKRRIWLNGHNVHLTPIEYQIITLLAKDSGKVLTYESIMCTIWGPYCGNDNEILRVHMTNLRKKIEPQSPQFQYVFTEPGIGYRMLENELCYGFTVNEANSSHISSSAK